MIGPGTNDHRRARDAGREGRPEVMRGGGQTGMAVPKSKAKSRGLGETQTATGPVWYDHMSATVEGLKLTLRDRPAGRSSRWVLCLRAHVRGSARGWIGLLYRAHIGEHDRDRKYQRT